MTLQELAYKEDDLYGKAIDLYHQPQNDETNKQLQESFLEYKKIHQAYAELSNSDLEALKRGLFIQWYALTEPGYLTGIGDLDENAENQIIQALKQIQKGHTSHSATFLR